MSGHFMSEDLLIRSQKEIQKNILPFLKIIFPDSSIQDLATFKKYGNSSIGGQYVGEEEAKDNFFKEQLIEDEYRQ